MKQLQALCFAFLCLSTIGCTDNSAENASLSAMLNAPIVSENGGQTDVFLMLVGNSSAPVQVIASISEPSRLSVDKMIVNFNPSLDEQMETIRLTCIDNQVKDGDHTVAVTFKTTSTDSSFNDLSSGIMITCSDDDTGNVDPIQPSPGVSVCTAGQILCIDSQQYRSCSVSSNSWSDSVTACPSTAPICDMTSNTCVSNAVPACIPVCAGTQIRQCSTDGTLLNAVDCSIGQTCQTVDGIGVCADISSDTVWFDVSTTEMSIFEGGSNSFTIKPGAAPNSTVSVIMSISDSSVGALSTLSLNFTAANWMNPQTVTVLAPRNGKDDGDHQFQVSFKVTSTDSRYNELPIEPIQVTSIDTEGNASVYNGDSTLKFRAMAANISSGNYQAYSPGHGIRIFQAVKPDIVMIQEFNWYRTDESDATALKLISEAFDSSFYVHRGQGSIPNGIISRFPIIDSGSWKSNKQTNRDWDWAIIDMPGPKELLVISVHLGTDTSTSEAPSLINALKKKINADSSSHMTYYTMIGGDFNRNFSSNGSLKDVFYLSKSLPVDQNGDDTTNAKRKSILDHLFVDKALNNKSIPVEIGSHSYKNGHVFDSRVYSKKGELGDVVPVRADDSDAENMQHMAVIRDFEVSAY